MKVSPKIKETLIEISKETIQSGNRVDESRKYVKKLLSIFDNKLSEEERIFLSKCVFRELSYKYNDEEKMAIFIINIRKIISTLVYSTMVMATAIIVSLGFGGEDFLKLIGKLIILVGEL